MVATPLRAWRKSCGESLVRGPRTTTPSVGRSWLMRPSLTHQPIPHTAIRIIVVGRVLSSQVSLHPGLRGLLLGRLLKLVSRRYLNDATKSVSPVIKFTPRPATELLHECLVSLHPAVEPQSFPDQGGLDISDS